MSDNPFMPTPGEVLTPQPTAPPAMPVMPEQKSGKGWLWAVVVVLVLVFGYSALAYLSGYWPFSMVPGATESPSPSTSEFPDTSNWQTYTSTEYGFTFRYPKNEYNRANPPTLAPFGCESLSGGTCTNPEGYEVGVISTCGQLDCDGWISVSVYLDPNNATYQRHLTDFSGYPSPTPVLSETLFGGASGFVLTSPDNRNLGYGPRYFLTDISFGGAPHRSYIISTDLSDETASQILSTFQFIDTATSDWQTYTNSAYGYQIRYPEQWTVATSGDVIGLRAPGTVSQPGDFAADVFVTFQNDLSIQDVIDATGSQFPDQQVTQESVKIDGREAVQLTVRTPSLSWWVSQSLLVQLPSGVLDISDGAQNLDEFWSIASTLTFTQ